MSSGRSPRSGVTRGARRAVLPLTVAASAAALGAATVSALVTFLARRVVTPEAGERADDVQVLGVGAGTITLRADPETTAPGRYGLWLDGATGHARLGEVIDHDQHSGTVTRHLLGVDRGRLREGGARWNQYFHAGTPSAALGLAHRDVLIDSDLGPIPAWLVESAHGADAPGAADLPGVAEPGQGAGRQVWAILVHGRGATREECLRALPVLHRLGLTALVVSYRNDAELEPTLGRSRYHLGESEWRDVEAAIVYALAAGAREVVLVGWSMGGAIILQLLDRSWTADRVTSVVLDAPVIDWRDVLDHHARLYRVPRRIGRMSQALLAHGHGRRLAQLETALRLDRMDWVARCQELRVPMLIIHSPDDDFVPWGPAQQLVEARADLVRLVSIPGAGHTREWNVDPDAWDAAVARFLLRD